MTYKKESAGGQMIKEYLGTDFKRSGFFVGSVLANATIVTVLFWLIFGFDVWKQDVQTASQLMAAAAVAPVVPVAQAPATAHTAGQFVCPLHGAVGLPNYDAVGTPHCPIDGQVMQFNGVASNNLTLAAGVG